MHVNRLGSRTGFRSNPELREVEADDIAEPDPDKTDEWRWTWKHLNREILGPFSRRRPRSLSYCAGERCQYQNAGNYMDTIYFPVHLLLLLVVLIRNRTHRFAEI
jgi:hypothetical protein